jgi:hypothetical protein
MFICRLSGMTLEPKHQFLEPGVALSETTFEVTNSPFFQRIAETATQLKSVVAPDSCVRGSHMDSSEPRPTSQVLSDLNWAPSPRQERVGLRGPLPTWRLHADHAEDDELRQ